MMIMLSLPGLLAWMGLEIFVTQPDTHPFVLVMPRFHTEWLESDWYDPADHQ